LPVMPLYPLINQLTKSIQLRKIGYLWVTMLMIVLPLVALSIGFFPEAVSASAQCRVYNSVPVIDVQSCGYQESQCYTTGTYSTNLWKTDTKWEFNGCCLSPLNRSLACVISGGAPLISDQYVQSIAPFPVAFVVCISLLGFAILIAVFVTIVFIPNKKQLLAKLLPCLFVTKNNAQS